MDNKRPKKKNSWNLVMFIACFATVLYLLIPLFLKIPFIREICACYLFKLGNSEYKSAFAESIGGLLGSFLAIVAALWTQSYFTKEAEKQAAKEDMRVVYYDLIFATNETYNILEGVAKTCGSISPPRPDIYEGDITSHILFDSRFEEEPKQLSIFKHDIHAYHIHVVDNWIRVVSALPDLFSKEEREHIYYMYGQINHINQAINAYMSAPNDLKYDYLFAVYQRMYNLLIITHNLEGKALLNTTHTIDIVRKHHISAINKLEAELHLNLENKETKGE